MKNYEIESLKEIKDGMRITVHGKNPGTFTVKHVDEITFIITKEQKIVPLIVGNQIFRA